jgi:hypothetical protein
MIAMNHDLRIHMNRIFGAIAVFGLMFASAGAQASTIFLTNNSAKTLASNEGDAAPLAGAGAGDTTALSLSTDDGGGTLSLSTASVFDTNGVTTIGMDADSLGVNNDKWGVDQIWTFAFDKTLSFDGFVLSEVNKVEDRLTISSAAWVGNTVTDGSNWTFDSVTGTITTGIVPAASATYDFTGAGLASVTQGTDVTIAHAAGGGGVQMHHFTVTVIPEPASLLTGLMGMTLIAGRRRR